MIDNIIRVFPSRNKWTPNDDMAFIGEPPLFRPEAKEVHISVVFTWDIKRGLGLYESWSRYYPGKVKIGGPAFNSMPGEFIPGMYIKQGVTITSRGCPFACEWCFVPWREGKLKELEIKDGWIVQDNNLLACSRQHVEKVFEMLLRQKNPIKFSGGLDASLLEPWHIDWFKKMRVDEFWFACDTNSSIKTLERASYLMSDFSRNKKRCYVLLGYNNESIRDAEYRLHKVYELGFLPFAQLYQGIVRKKYSPEWLKLNRAWSRPAITKSIMRGYNV